MGTFSFARFAVLFAGISTATSTFADIRAQTSYAVSGPSPRSGRLAGSQLGASWTEPFVDVAQAAIAFDQAMNGNPLAGYQAYREFRQFLDAASDKSTFTDGAMSVAKAQGGRLKVTFLAQSDDDPFGQVNVVVPPVAGIWSLGRTSDSHAKSEKRQVEIDLSAVPAGVYTLLFHAKETDCGVCLSITHKIDVELRDPVVVNNSPECRMAIRLKNSAEMALNAAYDLKQRVLGAHVNARGQIAHLSINSTKSSLDDCYLRFGSRLSPAYLTCSTRALDAMDFIGRCHDQGYAVASDGTCGDLRNASAQVSAAQDSYKSAVARLRAVCRSGNGPIDN